MMSHKQELRSDCFLRYALRTVFPSSGVRMCFHPTVLHTCRKTDAWEDCDGRRCRNVPNLAVASRWLRVQMPSKVVSCLPHAQLVLTPDGSQRLSSAPPARAAVRPRPLRASPEGL